ncbi:hypothetical protein [Acaryochloris marina]|uniref:hypothetical protein n=1 Tax=Acaryochloris marina TaxID=155978 RepID=UPI001BB02EF6|nr:hypothetical protein [Acaryochloris marina]QUY46020.1 hypothetical protein I1H34_30330 [Acaryochloris marina S15]
MKLELDLTPAEVEALQATLNHYKHVATEDSLDYLRGSQAQVFHYNASEVLRAISTEVVRQQGGPSFSIGQQEGETSQLHSPLGIWTRDNQQINDIRSAYITYPGLADVLAHDRDMYRTGEQREQYADVPEHVWSEQRGVLQIVAADMGFATELNRKDLSFAQLRQPDGVTPSERYGQQRSISPDRIRKALEARGMGQDSAFVHEASNGIKLAIDQNDDRVEVMRVYSDGDASWRYTSHKETPNGFVPGISNQMSGEERDALMEALTTLEQAKEIDDIDRYGGNEAVLKTFSQGLEQLKQDSPGMVGSGGGAKERIEQNLEVLRRTNDELAGRGDGELKELFDQADQIMDKEVYRNGDDLTAEGMEEPAITLEDTLPLDYEEELAAERYDPGTDLDAEPLPDAASVLDNEGRAFIGLPPLPNNGEIPQPMPTAQEIADEFGLEIVEPTEVSPSDPGQSENFFQKAAKGIKNVAKLAMPGSPGVEQSIADEYELSMIESIKYKWELQRSEEKDSPVNDLGQNANANFFELAQSAALDHGSIDRGDVVSLELPDGHQIYTWQDSVIISKEINGEPTILYEQEQETCHLPGNSETFRDKLSLEVKAAITGEVQELDNRSLADNVGIDINNEPDQEMSIFDMLSQPLGSIDMDGMDADIPPLTTERHAENKAFFDAIEQATLRQGELKEGFSKLDLGDGLTALAVPGDVVISRQDGTGNSSVLYEQSQDTSHLSGSGESYMDKLPKDYKDRIIEQVETVKHTDYQPKEAQASSKKSPVKGVTEQRKSKQSREADLGMGF